MNSTFILSAPVRDRAKLSANISENLTDSNEDSQLDQRLTGMGNSSNTSFCSKAIP